MTDWELSMIYKISPDPSLPKRGKKQPTPSLTQRTINRFLFKGGIV
jgi:hypothetical protein